MSLKEEVMIVNLSISQWSARKYDAKATAEVEMAHHAKDAGRFNKILLSSETLKEIGKVATKARTFHYENTLPWGDNGDRILPVQKYWDYIANIGLLKNEYHTLVGQFISEYQEEVQKAKINLNTLFRPEDYPNEALLRTKFDIVIGFTPIADSSDLRVKISESAINVIKAQITNEIESRIKMATDDLLDRVRKSVEKMATVLSEPTAIFRDSLVENIGVLIDTVPSLNFNNDPHVNECVELCKGLVVDPVNLRNNSKYRKEIAEKATKILALI